MESKLTLADDQDLAGYTREELERELASMRHWKGEAKRVADAAQRDYEAFEEWKRANPGTPLQGDGVRQMHGTPLQREAVRRMQGLRELCGYVEDGSDTSVTVFQDDATREWLLRVGDSYRTIKRYHGSGFGEVIDLAIAGLS